MSRTIFDVGMFDGADTEYYLDMGYRVVAVEANPELAERAKERFAEHVKAGRLTVVNRAIGPKDSTVDLILAGDDLGSSSVHADRVADKRPQGTVSVRTVTVDELMEEHGVPYFLKSDIEGADRECVLSLRPKRAPKYLSFEAGPDVEELIDHAASVGYRLFQVIDQCSFLPVDRSVPIWDRLCRRVIRAMGYDDPLRVRRAGRFFRLGHSSGPAPWKINGLWSTSEYTKEKYRKYRIPGHWYDVHAKLA